MERRKPLDPKHKKQHKLTDFFAWDNRPAAAAAAAAAAAKVDPDGMPRFFVCEWKVGSEGDLVVPHTYFSDTNPFLGTVDEKDMYQVTISKSRNKRQGVRAKKVRLEAGQEPVLPIHPELIAVSNYSPFEVTDCEKEAEGVGSKERGDDDNDDDNASFGLNESQIALLKSNLQKNVRMSRGVAAAQCAYRMARFGGNSGLRHLLRRLPVVEIEDARLSNNYPTLVWLMCVACADSKEYTQLRDLAEEWVCRATYEMAECPYVDRMRHLERDEPEVQHLTHRLMRELAASSGITPSASTCLWALSIRHKYGGLKGDTKMLLGAICSWYHRFKRLKQQPHKMLSTPSQVVAWLDDRAFACQLTPASWCWSAADFHCTSIAMYLGEMDLMHPFHNDRGVTPEEWRSVLWNCCSRRTRKRECASINGAPFSDTINPAQVSHPDFGSGRWHPTEWAIYRLYSDIIEVAQRVLVVDTMRYYSLDHCT